MALNMYQLCVCVECVCVRNTLVHAAHLWPRTVAAAALAGAAGVVAAVARAKRERARLASLFLCTDGYDGDHDGFVRLWNCN